MSNYVKMWIATMDRDIQCHFKSFEKIYLWKNARNSQKWRVWKGTTVLNKTKKQTADNLYSMLSGKRFGTTDSIMIETNRTERMGTSNLVRFTKRWSPEALCYFNDQKWLGMSNCVIYVNYNHWIGTSNAISDPLYSSERETMLRTSEP